MRKILIVGLVVLAVATAPSQVNAALTCFGQAVTITGSGSITGTPGDDVIVGSTGDDEIEGAGGNDVICGRAGNDTIADDLQYPLATPSVVWYFGEDGNDLIQGAASYFLSTGGGRIHNTLQGGAGKDELWAGRGAKTSNRVDGGPHADTCHRGLDSKATFWRCETIV